MKSIEPIFLYVASHKRLLGLFLSTLLAPCAAAQEPPVEVLQPRIVEIPLENKRDEIAPHMIEPHITHFRVEDIEDRNIRPLIINTNSEHANLGVHDIIYSTSLPPQLRDVAIYRNSRVLIDPETGEKLGRELAYLGSARIISAGSPTKLRIENAIAEIKLGDMLYPTVASGITLYRPHKLKHAMLAHIIRISGSVGTGGKNSTLVLNKGAKDGLQTGHVLRIKSAISHLAQQAGTHKLRIPDETHGFAFVYRVFDRVSYALVTSNKLPVSMADHFLTH